jgi:hypothetical protein
MDATSTNATVRMPYGVCLVTDREGTKAVTHVTREACQSGYVTDGPPLPSFRCEPAQLPLSEDEIALHAPRRGTRPDVMQCAIRPGTWIPDAVVTLHATTASGGPAPPQCFAVVRPEALAGVDFGVPYLPACAPEDL